jgi:hypothetical protein
MEAISLKCLLAGSQSSHLPPRIGRKRKIAGGTGNVANGPNFRLLKKGVKIAYLFPNKHKNVCNLFICLQMLVKLSFWKI